MFVIYFEFDSPLSFVIDKSIYAVLVNFVMGVNVSIYKNIPE